MQFALGEEPRPAAGAVVPPLALHARDVAAEIDVVRELAERRTRSRSRQHLAGRRELVDVAGPAVGAGEQERHYSVICNSVLRCAILAPIARTGQPSRGRIASSRRSVAILDA